MTMPRWSVLIGAVFSFAACRDVTRPPVTACTGSVTITVASGPTPQIDWTPACRAQWVWVADSTGANVWGIISDSTNAIEPPVTYGVVPVDQRISGSDADSLRTGMRYTVYVFRFTGPGRLDGALSGMTSVQR